MGCIGFWQATLTHQFSLGSQRNGVALLTSIDISAEQEKVFITTALCISSDLLRIDWSKKDAWVFKVRMLHEVKSMIYKEYSQFPSNLTQSIQLLFTFAVLICSKF